MSTNFQKYIDLFQPIMTAMQQLIGEHSEFILHDLSTPQSSASCIVGNVTNRQIGAPITNLVLTAIKEYGDAAPDMLDYPSVAKDGRQMKSSTIFIRDDDGKIVGCFCYNIDLTAYKMAENILKAFNAVSDPRETDKSSGTEVFAQDISEVVEDIVQYEITHFGKAVPHMNRSEKLQLVSQLEDKGVFDVKGSAEMVAHYLGVSVFTIYNYLKEIRSDHRI